jgi:hypothetical protein
LRQEVPGDVGSPEGHTPLPPPPDGSDTYTIEVEPYMIPELAATFAEQAAILGEELRGAEHRLRISEPWLGDPVSAEAARLFNNFFVDDELSLLNVLNQLRAQYKAHYEALMAAAKHYNMVEETNAALLERGITP